MKRAGTTTALTALPDGLAVFLASFYPIYWVITNLLGGRHPLFLAVATGMPQVLSYYAVAAGRNGGPGHVHFPKSGPHPSVFRMQRVRR
jgi:hypothetical protein